MVGKLGEVWDGRWMGQRSPVVRGGSEMHPPIGWTAFSPVLEPRCSPPEIASEACLPPACTGKPLVGGVVPLHAQNQN